MASILSIHGIYKSERYDAQADQSIRCSHSLGFR